MADQFFEADFFDSPLRKSKPNSDAEGVPISRNPVRTNSGRFQTTLSKIKPEVVKSVMAARMMDQKPPEKLFGTVAGGQPFNFSVLTPRSGTSTVSAVPPENSQITAPMTIFYNGTVRVFNVPVDKAEKLMWLAANGKSSPRGAAEAPIQAFRHGFAASSNEDLPIARRKSLQRFLEKRKDRLASTTTYGCRDEAKGKNLPEATRAVCFLTAVCTPGESNLWSTFTQVKNG